MKNGDTCASRRRTDSHFYWNVVRFDNDKLQYEVVATTLKHILGHL